MLEKPAIDDDALIHALNKAYGLALLSVSFLPLGAEINSAAYKAQASDETKYFVKLRRGPPSVAAVAVPTYLFESHMSQVIPALRTQTGDLWCCFYNWVMTLHPFIDGHHGYAQTMSPAQWEEFGAALKHLHTTILPAEIAEQVPREDFSSRWPEQLKPFLERIECEIFRDEDAAELATFLAGKKNEIQALIAKVDVSIQLLLQNPSEYVLCHADIHCWNLFIDNSTGALHIVDWDTLIFAPKERDLMFIGAGMADSGYTPVQEAEMFFRGYGQSIIDHNAMTYYRCARILEDLTDFCRQLLLSDEGGDDRKQALEFVRHIFRPNGAASLALGPTSII